MTKQVSVVFALWLGLPLSAQSPAVLPMAQSPAARVRVTLPAGAAPIEELKVTTVDPEPVSLTTSHDISALLTARGIEPTPDAIGLIYDLNPTLDDVRSLLQGAELVLPKVGGNAALADAIAKGYRVQMNSAETSFATLKASTAQLQQLADRVSFVRPERFRSAADQQRFIAAFTAGRSLVEQTLSGKYPLAEKVQRQTALYLAAMKKGAEAAIGTCCEVFSGPSADADDQQLDSTAVDAVQDATRGQQAIVNDLSSGGSALGLVEVTTTGTDGKPRRLLRVSYAPRLDPTSQTPFHGLTSPVAETLVVGADFTLTVPGADTPVTLRVNKANQPVAFLVRQ